MTIYYGVDFHARSQMISYLDTVDGEVHTRELHHQKDDVRAFYQQLSGEVIVGLEVLLQEYLLSYNPSYTFSASFISGPTHEAQLFPI